MAESSNGATAPQIDEIKDATLYKRSVQKGDYATGTFQFVFPAYGYEGGWLGKYTALPPALPAYDRFAFGDRRKQVLLTTPSHEAMWANTVAIATTKAAVWGWEVDSSVPLRRKRAHNLYQVATAGTFVGWIPFIYAQIRSYLLIGYGVVEIERETTSYYSRVTGLHHLNPLRCRLTDNPRKPVEYMDRQGQIHSLNYYDVMVFGDQIDPTLGEFNGIESAAMRVYDRIATMEATHRYLYEKITGKRPLSFEFIQGITSKSLDDAIKSSESDMERKGSTIYRGVTAIPIPGDIPIQRISIPLAEIPDGFNYQEIHDNTVIDYAAATGMDVNDLDPRLAQRMSLGSGSQALVLSQKAASKGMIAWRQDWLLKQNMWVLDTATTFSWSEVTLDDELRQAQLQTERTNNYKAMIDAGIISPEQARNLAVDAGDLPPEFVQEDMTAGDKLSYDEKPVLNKPENEQAAQMPEEPTTEPETQKAKKRVTMLEILEGELENEQKPE